MKRIMISLKSSVVVVVMLMGLFALSALSNEAQALPLAPGTAATAFIAGDNITGSAVGVLTPNSTVAPYLQSLLGQTLSGNVRAAVYDQGGGVLDFLYQVQNTGNVFVLRETDLSFLGIGLASNVNPAAVSAFFRTDFGAVGGPFVDGTVAPVSADRLVAGATVGFNFAAPGIGGTSSEILVVRVTANQVFTGNSAIIDGFSANAQTFSPINLQTVIPEPATLLLLGSGLAGLAGWRKWQAKKA